MKADTYLKLYSSCIPVRGYSRSIIIDTQRNNFHFIPNDLYSILTSENSINYSQLYALYSDQSSILEEYFNFLLSNELAFYTNEPENFPPISIDWETPRTITNAIIDISRYSTYNFLKAITEIDDLGAEAMQLRMFDEVSIDWLLNLLKDVTNYTKRIRSIELYIKYDEAITLQFLKNELEKFNLVSSVVIHSSLQNKIFSDGLMQFISIQEEIADETHCGIIKPYFFSTNIDFVLEAMNYNSCLNRKISIDSNGQIKNCPSLKESFGHIDEVFLKEIVKLPQFQAKWNITKENINICQDCEFRLICSDCRAYIENDLEKPIKCLYDPYIGKWRDQ